jgi:hypothetical protein
MFTGLLSASNLTLLNNNLTGMVKDSIAALENTFPLHTEHVIGPRVVTSVPRAMRPWVDPDEHQIQARP